MKTFEVNVKIEGTYTFNVKASSETEALEKAEEVFEEHWDEGKVDCGVLNNTEAFRYNDGETFRISDCW